MVKETEGNIISAHTTKIGKGDGQYGYIGIETPESIHLKMKIDMYTTYETLERGEDVVVKYDTLGDTGILIAKEITRKT